MGRKGKIESEAKSVSKEKEKGMGFWKLFSWSARGGSTGIASMIMGYLTIFCTDTMGIPAAAVGTLLLLSKFLDGLTDLFAGYLVDRTHTRWGKGRPYEWCVAGMWLSTLLLFMVPARFSTLMKLVWIFIMYAFANSVFYTFLNANGNVYMVRAFNRKKDYVDVSTYGGVVPIVMVLIFNIIFPTLMGKLATSQHGWVQLILIFFVPMVVLGMLRFFVHKEKYDVDVEAHGEKVRFRDVLLVLRRNPYIYIIAFGSFVMNIITNMGTGVYYFKYIVGNVGLMSVTAASQVVVVPLMFILPQILKKTTVVNVIKGGLLVTIAGYVLYYFANKNILLLSVSAIMTGGGVVPMSMLSGLLILECSEYNEYKGMRRLEGSLSSVNGFATKVGAGIGTGILGILLGAAGYDGTLAVQPASTITLIRMMATTVPAVMYLIVFLIFNFYTLGRKMPEIQRENEARRLAAAEQKTEAAAAGTDSTK